ncbi:hypothetical protein QOZ80_1BG0071930 [Eleusine coracana subsp. coracana]|nr:hypothetical protein QOZ80_1BG0071930 [Eleusine coracana subsp. coracana]
MAESVDWTFLPEGVLRTISGRLADPQDFISFRAVCQSGKRLCHAMPTRFRPWIVEKGEEDDDSGNVLFYSIISEKFHLIHVEALEGKRVVGYGAGLLLGIGMEDQLSAMLVNPLIGGATELPPLPECFRGMFTYGFATDPLMTSEEDIFVLVYNWPTLQVRSNVAMCCRGDDAGWAMIPSENFWMGMPSHRNHLLTHGPHTLQLQLEQAIAPNEMAWVPGMEAVHLIEHQGQVWQLARQELVNNMPAMAPRANFVLQDMVGHNGGAAIAWDDALELRDKVTLQSEDCNSYVLPASDFPGLCKNSIYFLSWERRDELNLEDGGDENDDTLTPTTGHGRPR